MNSDNVITKKGFSKFTEHFPHFFNNSSNEKSTYFWKTVYSEYWLIEKYIKIGNFLASNIAISSQNNSSYNQFDNSFFR